MNYDYTPEELMEKHASVLKNQDVQDLAHWKQTNAGEEPDEAKYLEKAISSLKGLKKKYTLVIEKISEKDGNG